MRKILISLGLLLALFAALIGGLLASGQIGTSSLAMLLNTMLGLSGPAANDATVRQRYQVPDGFTLELYAAEVPRARFLRFTPAGDLLVSRPGMGDILLLRRDADGDGHPDSRETLISGLDRPLGLDIHDGWLYIAESSRIGRVRFDHDRGAVVGDIQPLVEGLTDDGNHWSKTIRIGADQKLYLAQGSTCNICEEEDARRATMMRFELDGSQPEIIATGLRNSVGFDWAPWNGALYATDNGRDMLGDDFPPCELNRIDPGKFYGWPYFNGDNIPDPDMGADPLAGQRQPTPPAHNFRPHNAPLGMTFLNARTLPPEYRRSALAALHGSWNRSSPDGYKVVSLHWTEDGIEERDFLTGFLQDGDISGRPVDVAQGPDGDIFISDDYAGAIYRVAYGKDRAGRAGMGNPAPMTVPAVSRLDATPPGWLAESDLPQMAHNGSELYERYQCRTCHEQGTNPVRLDNLAQRLGYGAVVEVLEAPQSPMPLFPLSATERRELAVYLLWQPEAGE
ncbi:MAG: PQQ-dependent sugar dehydrogenase [Halioglobus sp.]|nr:PQQ-dependent sugar dehydrogenase [Halioglobus sp.]